VLNCKEAAGGWLERFSDEWFNLLFLVRGEVWAFIFFEIA
jgi:hypothetical protein